MKNPNRKGKFLVRQIGVVLLAITLVITSVLSFIYFNSPKVSASASLVSIGLDLDLKDSEFSYPVWGTTTVETMPWGYLYHLENGDTVQVGDNTTTDFRAMVKTIRWNGLCSFTLWLEGGTFTPSLDDLVVSFDFSNNVHVHVYPAPPSERIPEGGIEYDITLDKKPAQPRVDFAFASNGLTWQKILGLDAEWDQAACQAAWGDEYQDFVINAANITGTNIATQEVEVLKSMPEYEVNSYIGTATSVNHQDYDVGNGITYSNYSRTHLRIHRGQMTDSLGDTAWVEDITLDEEAGSITFDLPKTWLQNAEYPVSQVCGVDPAYTEDIDTTLNNSGGSDGVWAEKDVSGYGVSAGDVMEIIMGNGDTNEEATMGVRTYNSALARYVTIHEAEPDGDPYDTHCRMFVEVGDNSGTETIEVYHDDVSQDHYFAVVGFWTNVGFTEDVDIGTADNDDNDWHDIDLLTGMAALNASTVYHIVAASGIDDADTAITGGARIGGSSEDRKILIHEQENDGASCLDWVTKSDASGDIEVYDSNTGTIYYYNMGYFGSELDFVEDWELLSAITAGSWQTKDITSFLDQDGRVCDFMITNKDDDSPHTFGVRDGDDTTTNRYLSEHEAESWSHGDIENSGFSMSAKSNSSGEIGYYVEVNANNPIFFTGYFKPGGAVIEISCDQVSYDFGVVDASSTPSTATDWATIDNNSTVQTDQTISVTTSSWSGGSGWTHSDAGTPGADTAALLANRDGTWGVGDVTIKNASPDYIYENCPATTDYSFGIKLLAPTSYNPTNYQEKTIIVRVSAAAG